MTGPHRAESPGKVVAQLLNGSWRQTPPLPKITAEELEAAAPQILGSGSAGLVWRQIRQTDLKSCASASHFQQAYRLQSLYAGIHEIEIEQVTTLLGSAGAEPLLFKGRAIAGLYPELALRPYGDIDLCFTSQQYGRALACLATPEGKAFNVDPHAELDSLYGLSSGELFGSSRKIKVGEAEIRVPCFEDHLRILCIHFLKHGAWRPLNLCDVAAAVESLPAGFDWDRCLGSDKLRRDWVVCAMHLARELLGARLDDAPLTARAGNLPRWLVPAVLKQWENPYPQANETPELMLTHLRKRSGVISELKKRWPNPIRATVYFHAPFNGLPRFPLQVLNCFSQAARFIATLPRVLASRQR